MHHVQQMGEVHVGGRSGNQVQGQGVTRPEGAVGHGHDRSSRIPAGVTSATATAEHALGILLHCFLLLFLLLFLTSTPTDGRWWWWWWWQMGPHDHAESILAPGIRGADRKRLGGTASGGSPHGRQGCGGWYWPRTRTFHRQPTDRDGSDPDGGNERSSIHSTPTPGVLLTGMQQGLGLHL